MTTRILDSEGDIITQGVQFFSQSAESIAQTISTKLKLFYGEYFRDITDGTPWFENILGKGTSLDTKEATIRRRISQTEGVNQILAFSADFDIDTRQYTITASVLTDFGVATINVGDII